MSDLRDGQKPQSKGSTLKELLQQAQDKAALQADAAQNLLMPKRGPVITRPRGFASPQDVYATDIGYNSPLSLFNPGARRPMWFIPPVAITHVPVDTLRSSAVPRGTQTTQIIGSGAASGIKAATVWATVPNLELTLAVNGPVHLIATLPVQSTATSDPILFAFYRGGILISQIFSHTTASVANTPTTITLSYVDALPELHGLIGQELYSLFWKGASGNVTSPGNGRSMFLTSLIPS